MADRLCITDVNNQCDLRFEDCETLVDGLRVVDHKRPQAVAELIAAKMALSDDGRADGLTELHLGFLQQLPPAIRAAGSCLKGLHIKMLGSDAYHPHITEERLSQLAVSCKDLTNIEFRIGDVNWDAELDISPENASSLRSLLDALTVSTNIRHLSLDPHVQQYSDIELMPFFESFGTCLSGSSWPNLRTVTLRSFTFRLPELRRFLTRLDGKIMLDLCGMCLMGDGKWAEVLDLLRERSTDSSYLGVIYGGELRGTLEHAIWEDISQIELISYITGYSDDNPLVSLARDSVDGDDSDEIDNDEMLDW